MTGTAHLEQDALPELEPTVTGHEPVSAGTYSLRRLYYFGDTGQDSPLSGESLEAVDSIAGEDDFDAEQKTLIQHLRMVASIARQYAHSGVDAVELVKAGNLGLGHALEHFEPSKAAHFSGYAAMCVRQHIERFIADRRGRLEVAQNEPQYAASRHRTGSDVGTQANHQGIYVIRTFIENRINELRHSRHVEFSPEYSGLYD